MAQSRKSSSEINDTLKFKERISFRTNTIDWLLTRPNIGFEFDLTPYDYNKWTIGADFLCNWNTKENHVSSFVYDLASATLEGRKYYRTYRPGNNPDRYAVAEEDTTHWGMVSWVNHLTRLERKNARSWRAYYVGFYGQAAKYSIKVTDIGHQGTMFSAGGAFGFSIPLVVIDKSCIDFELGGRIGAVFTHSDAYTISREDNCYPAVVKENKDWHLVPYPVVVDAHASLVYRFLSVGRKYRKPNYKRLAIRREREQQISQKRDSLKMAKASRLEEIKKIEEENQKAREGLKKRKAMADSLDVPLESIPLTPEELKVQKRQETAEAELNAKKGEKAKKKSEEEKADKPKKGRSKDDKPKKDKKVKLSAEERKAAITAAKAEQKDGEVSQ